MHTDCDLSAFLIGEPAGVECMQIATECLPRMNSQVYECMQIATECRPPRMNSQVLRYGVGDHYHYHLDNGGSSAISGRVLTALVYLSDAQGGETNWPMANGTDQAPLDVVDRDLSKPNAVQWNHVHRLREHFHNCQTTQGLTLAPRRGTVALFYSMLPNSAEKDWMAWHASCDVHSGTKWAANFWWQLHLLREKRAPAPGTCSDSEPSCAAWATSGECAKNRDYMSQNCRKACGLCGV